PMPICFSESPLSPILAAFPLPPIICQSRRPSTRSTAPRKTCNPDRPLTWDDFGGPPKRTGRSAGTEIGFSKLSSGGLNQFEAHNLPSLSWGLDMVKRPADRNKSGCAEQIRNCEAAFSGKDPKTSFG